MYIVSHIRLADWTAHFDSLRECPSIHKARETGWREGFATDHDNQGNEWASGESWERGRGRERARERERGGCLCILQWWSVGLSDGCRRYTLMRWWRLRYTARPRMDMHVCTYVCSQPMNAVVELKKKKSRIWVLCKWKKITWVSDFFFN